MPPGMLVLFIRSLDPLHLNAQSERDFVDVAPIEHSLEFFALFLAFRPLYFRVCYLRRCPWRSLRIQERGVVGSTFLRR
jgi:hypothetical protein